MPLLRIQLRDQAFEATLPDSAVRVGTGPLCDLTLACEGVAAEHCVLEPMAGGAWRVKDLGSGLPTRINGTEVKQASLTPGDCIDLGEASILFAPDLAPAAARPAAARPAAARPAAVGPAAVGPAAPPPNYPAPAAPARSALAVGSGGADATGSPVPAGTPPPPLVVSTPARPRRSLRVPVLLALLAGGVFAALGLRGGGEDPAATAARARRDLDAAVEHYRARDYLAAKSALAALVERERTGDVVREATTWLASANQAVAQAEGELDGWVTRALDFDLTTAPSRSAVFLEQHGKAFAARVERALTQVRGEQDHWRRTQVAEVQHDVAAHVAASHFREACARWRSAQTSAPRGVNLEAEAQSGLEGVEGAASLAAELLLERVGKAAQYRGPAAGVEVLGLAIAHYEGTAVHGRLADRLAELTEAAAHAAPTRPTSTPAGSTPGQPTPTPTEPAGPLPPTDAETQARVLEQARTQVASLVAVRSFAAAVDALDRALAQVGEGPVKAELTARRADLALARNGLDTLAGDITSDAKKYGRIEMSEKLFVSPTAADRDGLTCALSGGSTKLRWATMRTALLVDLAQRMKPSPQDALSVAALLHELGDMQACEQMLVRAGEGVSDLATVFGLLARWRGEELPASGYVLYEGRYVSPADRERLVFQARVRGGIERLAAARTPTQRREAIDELLALGEGAREPLLQALGARRAALVDEIVADRVWTAARTRQKLWELLEQRRAHALLLIEDQAAYPYPNPGGQGQAEVERRVGEVREVWERPFRLVAAFDDSVKVALERLIEVDEALARVLPGHRPDLSALEERAGRVVDMPGFVPPGAAAGVREYSLKVLAFNERIPTSATREEKDNVRAVNEYRMMMGRQAVKIEERLLRAARGHSRHMSQHGYFAHDAPAQFADVRTPGQRARRQGYGGGVGENIAMGTPTGRDAFRAWFGSSGHHRNMLGRGWTEMGAGRSVPHHWTQLFGAAGGKSLDDPSALPPPAADVAPDPDGAPTTPQQPLVPRVPDERPPGEQPDTPTPPGSGG